MADTQNPRSTQPVLYATDRPALDPGVVALDEHYLTDETRCVETLLGLAQFDAGAAARVQERAAELVRTVRANRKRSGGIDAFLIEYDLSSQEGVVLMCLAEALLRVPDTDTADKLIRDKLTSGNWRGHLGGSQSLFVNASTWGLMLTGRIIGPDDDAVKDPSGFMSRIVSRAGEPVVRTAMRQAMRIMGHQYVMGRTIDEALTRARSKEHRAFRHSFDMLGEAALTQADAEDYFQAYAAAINAIGKRRGDSDDVFAAPGISVKLSALHPRYEFAQARRVIAQLTPRLLQLAQLARTARIGFTVDAEEADRLGLSLEIFSRVFRSPTLQGWEGYGLAVQAYQKRALPLIDWLVQLGRENHRRIAVRLVKGAYWDTEIKRAQEQGLEGYPVFTRKSATDVSYLACARRLLAARDAIYPQFATHNAHTLASIVELADGRTDFEFQRLHGMGEELYEQVVAPDRLHLPCRVYAPVGSHEDLLPYLVRRLLENGANTSFVNRIVDEKAPIEEIVADPVEQLSRQVHKPHPSILLPQDMFGSERSNSRGINLENPAELKPLQASMQAALGQSWRAAPVINGNTLQGESTLSTDPADNSRTVGEVVEASVKDVDAALAVATAAQPDWDARGGEARAAILEAAADRFEANMGAFCALCTREAGKTVVDGVSEVREAVDFLRYYAARCRSDFSAPLEFPGPTGEANSMTLGGRGVFVAISPWNYPLAIFTGQVAAALAAGNSVLAKPAEQTPLVAAEAVRLLFEAGVPAGALAFLPGRGATVGAHAVANAQVAGVAFTGSTQTAMAINRSLAQRSGPIATLIAETGGQNAMIVDSSALPEQVTLDVVQSAFGSAGQRCSALRVLFLQDEIAPRVLELLRGHMDELVIGDPAILSTDIGPVIDQAALNRLQDHARAIAATGTVIHRLEPPSTLAAGTFFGPMAVEITAMDQLEGEVFGPVLHVVRYAADQLGKVVDTINASGFGLTLGVHSRIDSTARYIAERVRAGNVYVNRNMVGAVVGVQPFGGRGLSGTGPKAGGPHYLHRFATEKTLSVNTAAVGGNTSLLTLN